MDWGVGRMPARYRENGRDSFWGDSLYDMVVPKTHFLRQLTELLDWDSLTAGFADYYKGGAEYGPVPYHPTTLLKMLLIAYLYGLSERETEQFCSDSLAARYFLGLAANEAAPDHSTLCVYRTRILDKGGQEAYDEMFKRVVRMAKAKGIQFGRIQVVDATHSIADVDVAEDDKRHKEGKARRDKGASWGCKGQRQVKTSDGKKVKVNKMFYGYKSHFSLNAESEIITAVVPTTGRLTDGQQFPELVKKDEEAGIEAQVYSGDKGYDDGENHELLRQKGKKSALTLNRYRTEKKDGNKELWIKLKADEDYQAGKKVRYKIEQKNGESKRGHGLGRCRYLGIGGYAVQSYLTAMALNLKRMVRLLCCISFQGRVTIPTRG
jgi:IS5 family transposase